MMETRTARNFVIDRYADLSKSLVSFPNLLSSLSEKLQKASLIDQGTAKTITSNGGRDGAHLLLDTLYMRLEQSQDYEPLIVGILKDDGDLEELCQPVEKKGGDTVPPQQVEKPDSQEHYPAGSSSKAPTALAAATMLLDHFESMLPPLTEAISSNPSYSLDCLKVRISLYLQYVHQNTPEVEHFLHDLEKCLSASSIMKMLTQSNIVSYLNFQLLDAIKSEEFDKHLERYASEHRAFTGNSINSIAEIFMREPRLALPPVCGLHLPEITVELHSRWEAQPYSHWQKIMEDNAHWSNHIMIKSLQTKPIVITYYVFPFVWPKVVNDLVDNTDMIKRFTAIGATFTIPREDQLESGNKDYEKMKLGVQRALTLMKIEWVGIPLAKTGFDKEKQATSSGNSVEFAGGYSRSLFCSRPPDKFDCIICFSTVKEPLQFTCCGKVICKGCHLSNECPSCRAKNPKTINDKRRKREIMKLKVRCPASECYWIGTLDCLENQPHECPKPKEIQQKQHEQEEMKSRAASAENKMIYVMKQRSDPTQSKQQKLLDLHHQTSAPVFMRSHKEDSKGGCVYTVTGLGEKRIDWRDKGSIIINIPFEAIPPDQTCNITVTPVQPSDCVLPIGAILVSEIFEVTMSCDIVAPITINLRHCVELNGEDARNCLSFAKAESTGSSPHHILKEHKGGVFSSELIYGELKCKKFSFFSVLWLRKLGIPCTLRCCVQIGYYFSPESDEYEAIVLVTKNNGELPEKAVERSRQLKKDEFEIKVTQVVEMIDDIIVATNKRSDDGLWEVNSKQDPCKIPKGLIEDYDGKQGAVPPLLSYLLLLDEGCSSRLNHSFRFTGLKLDPYSLQLNISPHKGDKVKSRDLSIDTERHQLNDEDVYRLKQLVIDTIERKYSGLHNATEDSLTLLARKLIEEKLLARHLVENANYDKMMNSVISTIDWGASVSDIEESFKKFIRALHEIGGPARKASKRLSTELQSAVRREFEFDFKIPQLS